MEEVTLISRHKRPLKYLVEAALQNESRVLDAGITRTKQRLREFEAQYGMTTNEFISRYENNELDETLELTEWVGEYRLLRRLKEKSQILSEVEFAN